jgi:hypothetical protein
MVMRVQIRGEEKRFCLWLPLFLLLPLALVLLIILSPLILVAIIILRLSGRGKHLSPIIRAAFDVLCSMPGLRVDVSNRNERVYISVI